MNVCDRGLVGHELHVKKKVSMEYYGVLSKCYHAMGGIDWTTTKNIK